MRKLKAAIILDNLEIAQWQKIALEEASDILDIKIIINCKNTKNQKKIIKNFLYYSLNIFTLKIYIYFTKFYNLECNRESLLNICKKPTS